MIVLAQGACRSDNLDTPVTSGGLAHPLTGGITGELYVSNRPGPTYKGSQITCATWISVYGAGTNKAVRKLPGLCKGRDGNAALAFDGQGNAYWADFFNGAVLVFAPKKSKPSYTIAWGASNAYSVAVDRAGRLYVANLGPGVVGSGESSVSVYAAGKDRPSYSITDGISYPTTIVESASSKLYVANCPFCDGQYYGYSATATIAVYEVGEKKPTQVISKGIVQPTAMAVDSSNNLYVANSCGYPDCASGMVSVYKAGADSPYLTLSNVGVPDAVVVDSAGTVYVGAEIISPSLQPANQPRRLRFPFQATAT